VDPENQIDAALKAKTGSGLALETVTNTYDQARAGFFNAGQLTRTMKERAGTPNINLSDIEIDYDTAGRPVKQAFAGINGSSTPKGQSESYRRRGNLSRCLG
jgi:hypothetical protein